MPRKKPHTYPSACVCVRAVIRFFSNHKCESVRLHMATWQHFIKHTIHNSIKCVRMQRVWAIFNATIVFYNYADSLALKCSSLPNFKCLFHQWSICVCALWTRVRMHAGDGCACACAGANAFDQRHSFYMYNKCGQLAVRLIILISNIRTHTTRNDEFIRRMNSSDESHRPPSHSVRGENSFIYFVLIHLNCGMVHSA